MPLSKSNGMAMYLLFTSRSTIRLKMEGHPYENSKPIPVPYEQFFALLYALVKPFGIQDDLNQTNINAFLFEANAPIPGTLAGSRKYVSNVTNDPAKIRKAFDLSSYGDDNPCPGQTPNDDETAIFQAISSLILR